MDSSWLLFLHGINASEDDRWREPLDDAMARFGSAPFPDERVLTPDYRAALRGEVQGADAAATTWKAPPRDVARKAKTAYLAKMTLLEARLRPLANSTPVHIPRPRVPEVPAGVSVVDDARRYSTSSDVRAAVHDIVLRSLEGVPKGARIVIVAHSLGSVVAADLVKKLPPHLRVAGLVTVGSPLGAINVFRSREWDDFPFDRLGAWVNVFDPRDPVTGGRGISSHYGGVIDIPVMLPDWNIPDVLHRHHAEFYCAHGAVAAAIIGMLVGTDVARLGSDPRPGVAGLELLLLQSLYLRELAKLLPSDDHDRLARLELARRSTAASHAAVAAALNAQNPATAALSATEFFSRPDAHIRGAWDDATVLALAITLASGLPIAPFQIEDKPEAKERRDALIATLSLIREHRTPTDVDIAHAVFDARKPIVAYLAPQGRRWVPTVLIAAGVLTLAATGIGLAAAVPAGLAGAAVVTSTLAVFGPGGMVGGMATLAALAGAGSAMAAAGVAGAAFGAAGDTQQPDLVASALDEAVASGDVDSLRALLVSLLTLVSTQERLEFATQRDRVLDACLNAEASLTQLIELHEAIDPKSDATKSAKEMLALLGKASRWLRGEEKPETPDAREWHDIALSYEQAMKGDTETFIQVMAAPARRPESAALIAAEPRRSLAAPSQEPEERSPMTPAGPTP